jgi:hypothetical protein
MKQLLLATAVLSTFVLSACDETSTSKERRVQEEISKQGVESVGFPAITNFAEKRMMKDIIELRDQNVATTVYITDLNGKLHKVCNAVGYGLPYATQYTNPQKVSDGGRLTLPQADPNGLYSPASADGTWILCVDGKGKPRPVYIEPRVIVSPFPLGE